MASWNTGSHEQVSCLGNFAFTAPRSDQQKRPELGSPVLVSRTLSQYGLAWFGYTSCVRNLPVDGPLRQGFGRLNLTTQGELQNTSGQGNLSLRPTTGSTSCAPTKYITLDYSSLLCRLNVTVPELTGEGAALSLSKGGLYAGVVDSPAVHHERTSPSRSIPEA